MKMKMIELVVVCPTQQHTVHSLAESALSAWSCWPPPSLTSALQTGHVPLPVMSTHAAAIHPLQSIIDSLLSVQRCHKTWPLHVTTNLANVFQLELQLEYFVHCHKGRITAVHLVKIKIDTPLWICYRSVTIAFLQSMIMSQKNYVIL